MASFRMRFLISILILSCNASALQVAPNSPCASVCLDDPTADHSDPGASNTYSSDIVCSNTDLDSTSTGQKFELCNNCLRNSTVSNSGENDQSWFLYNLRFALDSCLFGFQNSSASDAQSTPCSTTTSCGPLRESLENGDLVPSNETTYSYCSANNNALLGSFLPVCIGCLQDTMAQSYLANFLIALQAGCIQQPVIGSHIGIRGNIFSSNPLNITFPGDNPAAQVLIHKRGLSEAAIIGIVAGIAALLVVAVAVGFVCYRKKSHARSMKRLNSPLDPRFGAKSISTPNSGSYGNPSSSSSMQLSQKYEATALSPSERRALGLELPEFLKTNPTSTIITAEGWQDAHAHLEATQDQLPTNTALPAHQAYIPAAQAPKFPAATTKLDITSQVSSCVPSRSSPKDPPPPIKVPPPHGRQNKPIPAQQVEAVVQPLVPLNERGISTYQKAQTAHDVNAPSKSQIPHCITINTKVQAANGLPRVPIPQDGQRPPFLSQAATTPQQYQLAHFQTPRQQMTSQIGPPAPHSYQQVYPQIMCSRPDDRPPSRAWSFKRSESRGTVRESSRERTTNGGRKRSESRGRFRASSPERLAVPVKISGPMIRHGGRFDFEAAEQEMREREEKIRKGPDATPSSAESEEQWPGAY